MFKKLLTTMLVLAIVVTAGTALAGDGSYTVYGKLHSSINMLNNGDNSQLDLTSNTSRFGLKGANELNDTFTFIWQFESKLDIADQTGTLLSRRNSYVGFKHAEYGQVRMGIHDTPFKTLGRKVELFSDELGDFRSLTSMGPQGTKWDNRLPDILAWVSPNWDGFGLFLAYQMDQADRFATASDSYRAKTAFSGMATYARDEFFVGAALEADSDGYAPSYMDGASEVIGDSPMAMRFVGKYTAEQFKLTALYQVAMTNTVTTDPNSGDMSFLDANSSTLGFGAQYMAAPKWNVKAQYYMKNIDTDAVDNVVTDAIDESDTKANMFAIGVDHIVNKSVKIYAQWATITNGDMTNVALGGGQSGFGGSVSAAPELDTNGDPTALSQNPMGFSVGTAFTW